MEISGDMDINFTIRTMTESDLDQVTCIENTIFSMPWSKKSFQDAYKTQENIYLVCEQNDKIIGYCGMWTVLDEGNITNMAVDSNYRGIGCGKNLMMELEKRGLKKNVTLFFLEVRESNQAARCLYDKLGYNTIGIRKRFYERPVENAIVMSKTYINNL